MRRQSLRLKIERPKISEKARQAAGVSLLQHLGYRVELLGQIIKPAACNKCSRAQGRKVYGKCPSCGDIVWPQGYGNSEGVADTLVTHEARWPGGVWMMMEWKQPGGKRRQAQIDLVELGSSVFVENEAQAIDTLIAFEKRIGVAPNPRLLSYLRDNESRRILPMPPGTT